MVYIMSSEMQEFHIYGKVIWYILWLRNPLLASEFQMALYVYMF